MRGMDKITQDKLEEIKILMNDDFSLRTVTFQLETSVNWSFLHSALEHEGFRVPSACPAHIDVAHSPETAAVAVVTKKPFSVPMRFEFSDEDLDQIIHLLEKRGHKAKKVAGKILEVHPKQEDKPLIRSAQDARAMTEKYAVILTHVDSCIGEAASIGKFSVLVDNYHTKSIQASVIKLLRAHGYQVKINDENFEISWRG